MTEPNEPTPPSDAEAVDAALVLLSLVTGDEWDRAKLLEQSGHMRDLAVHTLRKQGLTEQDADTFVEERWQRYAADIPQEPPAASIQPDPSPSTQTSGDLSSTAKIEANTGSIPTLAELRDRLANYHERRSGTQEDPASEEAGSPGAGEASSS